MDLEKNGKLLCDLRKKKELTQKQVAEKLGVTPKTISKWETGHGFPDISTLSALADVLGVSERAILSGNLDTNLKESGNMKRTNFYVCPECGSFLHGTGNCRIICCGKPLEAEKAASPNDDHMIKISEIEDDYYIEFAHEMTKEHYIGFVSYVRFDRVLTIKLYPEQDASVRFPKMFGGKLYYHCSKHGLFEYQMKSRR